MIAIDDNTILADNEEAPEIITTLTRSESETLKGALDRQVERSRLALALSATNQMRINAATQKLETKVAEGMGEWVCRIDRIQFEAQRRIHGQGCWHDPEFVAAFLRDNPSYRLKYHAKNYVNGWNKEAA